MQVYFVLNDCDFKAFIQSVNKYLAKGWSLWGGLAITRDEQGECFYQAITKELKPDETYESVVESDAVN